MVSKVHVTRVICAILGGHFMEILGERIYTLGVGGFGKG